MNEDKPKTGVFIKAQECASLLFFAVMCVLMVFQMLSRYIFSSPLLFTEEFSRFCYVWVAFLGLAIAHHRSDHIKIDLFVNLLPRPLRRAVAALVGAVSIALLAWLCYWGVEYLFFNEYSVAASVDFPLYYVYAALPVGCALGIVNIVVKAFK